MTADLDETKGATMTVFLVSDGEHDDYRVRALFADRADADRYVTELGGRVEEFPLVGRLGGAPARLYVAEGSVPREDLLPHPAAGPLGRSPVVMTRQVWPGATGPAAGEIAVDAYVVNSPGYGPLAHIEVVGYDEAAVRARYAEVAAEKRREVAGMPDLRQPHAAPPPPGLARGGFVRYDESGVDVSTMG